MKMELKKNWVILQDVHNTGENLQIFKPNFDFCGVGHQISEWEPIDELIHLQLLFSENPYFGRELRYYNQAPWWYKNEFEIPVHFAEEHCVLKFTNVDYFCKVWFNGEYIGDHEGYSIPFAFDVSHLIKKGSKNVVMVKVWSPWDNEVRLDTYDKRTYMVIRDLTKGTYEHDDTFIARNVNPIGIYGSVSLEFNNGARFTETPFITYELSDDLSSAHIKVTSEISNRYSGKKHTMVFSLIDCTTQLKVAHFTQELNLTENVTSVSADFVANNIRLWHTWDRGTQSLYELKIELINERLETVSVSNRMGFRKVELQRDIEQTTFFVNGQKMYIRGTSYFPDVYVSKMIKDRYRRDLFAIKTAGFNLIRVHVHVELRDFYDLCDELGLVIMQDSEYNWTHPIESEWAERFIKIYGETVKMLNNHPSIICWICLNEPGVRDPAGRTTGYAMQISPGPKLYEMVTDMDPTRAVIKGSFCFDDLLSGDSHNYTGSLNAPDVHYTAIYGTKEKLNTEFGFDAPGCAANLKTVKPLYARLKNLENDIPQIQYYQYRLTKYYIEHYRIQKYQPCSGFVQFMFIDLCPQSFYGVYDYWGVPKMGLNALMESNQPIGVFMEQTPDIPVGIWLVNDLDKPLGSCKIEWTITDDQRALISSGENSVYAGNDSITYITDLSFDVDSSRNYHVSLIVKDNMGNVLTTNTYEDAFHHPVHVKGHPSRMSHELGARVYYV